MRATATITAIGFTSIILAGQLPAASLNLFRPVEITTGTWLLAPTIPGEPQVGVIIGSRSVAIVGAPKSGVYARQIIEHVQELTEKPVSHVIVLSQFCDHACGSAELSARATIVASENLDPRTLTWMSTFDEGPEYYAGAGIANPDIRVSASTTIDLGGRTVEVRKVPSTLDKGALIASQPDVRVAWTGTARDTLPGFQLIPGNDPSTPHPRALSKP
jgi:glyoxylase-like metal-dependent hydrolase (beta-lactamase superfamily II)